MTASELRRPIELVPIFRARVWGRETLAPYFGSMPGPERIGEVWFTFEENQTALGTPLGQLLREHPELLGTARDPQHPGICPLLLKLLLTTERLSVQVHPDDDYAQQHHGSLGKTEAWYVLDAQPPGEVAIGFNETLGPDTFQNAVKSGEIEHLLHWKKVQAGDIVSVPAGTVHAVGAGLIICEIQENSDITYRLYDYGRPRELHLEHGVRVSHLEPHTAEAKTIKLAEGRDELLACDYFRIERLRPQGSLQVPGGLPYYSLLICVKGSGTIDGETCKAGQAWLLPAQSEQVAIDGAGSEWIFTYTADEPAVSA
jgi:mannose-6-phosphate isomerase